MKIVSGMIVVAAAIIGTTILGGQKLDCYNELSDDESVKVEICHQEAQSTDWNYILKFTYYEDGQAEGWWMYEETEDLNGRSGHGRMIAIQAPPYPPSRSSPRSTTMSSPILPPGR